jgi:deaminated glutathione amidase
MQRRQFVSSVSALAAMAPLAARSAAAQEAATPPPYRAAVMRVPVIVPPTLDTVEATRAKNAENMVAAIESVMKGPGPKPRIVVFPVLQYTSARRAVSGTPMSMVAVDLISEPLDKGIFKPVIEACRRHNCYVATSTQEKVPQMPGRYFHTGFIMGPEGLVLRSPKSQAQSAPEVSFLRDIADEYKKIFGPDSILPVVQTPIGKLGCYVEGEAEVLEVSRLLASKGAEVIVHTSMEGNDTPWQAIKQAIGYQCHVYLLTGTTSRIYLPKTPDGEWMGGSSTIVDPEGRVLAQMGGKDEGFVVADVDLAVNAAARKKHGRNTIPAWNLYTDLYKR